MAGMDYSAALVQRAAGVHTEHHEVISKICDLMEQANVKPEDGHILLCLTIGLSLHVLEGRVVPKWELEQYIDFIGVGMVLAESVK